MKKNKVHREPLTSDLIFKAVFGQDTSESKEALIGLLNIVLDREKDPIVNLVYKNPFSIAEAKNEKEIVMDIKVETEKRELIDIEMQIGDLDIYVDRTVYYGCKQLAKGLDKGEDYDKMKSSIVISFIKGKLFPDSIPVASKYTFRDNTSYEQLTEIIQLHYIELGKIDWSDRSPGKLSPLEQIGAYLTCAGNPDETDFVEALIKKGVGVISMTDNVLKKVSEEERLQYLRESREMAKMQISWEKQAARERGYAEGHAEGLAVGHMEGRTEGLAEGHAEGHAEGLAEGHAEGHAEGLVEGRIEGLEEGNMKARLEMAGKLKLRMMPISEIMEITGLSEEEINKL